MKNISAICLLGSTALWLAAAPAQAQVAGGEQTPPAAKPASTAPQDDSKASELQDIIVTATRTGETNLQKTPIAVTAFSPDALKSLGVTSALNLNGLAPNVSIGGRNGAGATQGAVTIRGVGVDANPPASPAVGIYVDDVYIPASYGNLLGTYDLAQLEILRGPQGTLFGRNTIGGALQYSSVRPKIGDLSAFLEGTVGNQKRGDVSGGINLPLTPWAALRFSGAYTNRDGYVHDLLNNVNRGSEHNSDLRVQLRLQPASNLTIDLKAEEVHQESNGAPATVAGFIYTAILGQPFAANRGLDRFISPSYYTTYGVDGAESFTSTLKLAQGVVNYNVTPDVKLKSVTAYSENKDLFVTDQDRTPAALINVMKGNDLNKLFTQELQLSGKKFNDRVHFTLGAYYYDETSSNTDSCTAIFGAPCVNNTFGNFTVKTKSYAAYGQATFDITHQLSVVGGLRYTRDDITVVNPLAVAGAGYPGKTSFGNWSPLAGVNFQVTRDILLYAKWSRGFRAGSYSPNLYSPNGFGPETLESYEAGARLELFGHRVRINPTIFATNWKNIQFNSLAIYFPPVAAAPTPAPIVQNAGNARTKGAEIETQFQVTPRFMVTANGSLFEGHYTSLLLADPDGPGPAPASPVATVTLGTPLKRAPKASFSVGGRYELPLFSGKLALNANYAWQAHQRSATSNNDNIEIPAYGLLNSRLIFTAPGDSYSIALFVNNLTNVRYLIGGTAWGNGGLIPEIEKDVGRPREFGLTARFNVR